MEPRSVVDVWSNDIVGSLPQPIFDKYSWNMYDTFIVGLPRSNNLVEGWHNGFLKLVGCFNPTLWTFLTALKREENLTFSKKVKMSLGEGPEPKRRKWRMYDERFSSIVYIIIQKT